MPKTNHHVRRFALAVFAITALALAGAAMAVPICETDCTVYTSCDQVCRIQGCNDYSTCAMYICDEPQLPWPPGFAAFNAVFGESAMTPANDVEAQLAAGSSAGSSAAAAQEAQQGDGQNRVAEPSSSDD